MYRLIINWTGADGTPRSFELQHADEQSLRFLTRILRGNTDALARVTSTRLLAPTQVITGDEIVDP